MGHSNSVCNVECLFKMIWMFLFGIMSLSVFKKIIRVAISTKYELILRQSRTKNSTCAKTGLQSALSLNYSLRTFLYLGDKYWILSLIDIESFNMIIEKHDVSKAQNKLNKIDIAVKNFCDNNTSKLIGFIVKYNDLIDDNDNNNNDCQHEIFGLLMHCHSKFNISKKYILKFWIKKIKKETNEIVFVGICKMYQSEIFEQWKTCALQNFKNDRNIILQQQQEQIKIVTHS